MLRRTWPSNHLGTTTMPRTEQKPRTAEPAPVEKNRPAVGRRRNARQSTAKLPLLPIRDQVYFPHMIFPLLVGREKSVRALEEAVAGSRQIMLVAQRRIDTEEPDPEDLYEIGIMAEILQVLRVPDGTVRVMLEGLGRVRLMSYVHESPYYLVQVQPLPTLERKDLEIEALMRGVTAQFEQI